jgi:hypothetical protein
LACVVPLPALPRVARIMRKTAWLGRWRREPSRAGSVRPGRARRGHPSPSLTVETYLARPAVTVEVASAADYFRATRAAAAGPAVAARGRDAGAALGTDPAAAVAEIAARVIPLVDARDGTALVTTIAGHPLARTARNRRALSVWVDRDPAPAMDGAMCEVVDWFDGVGRRPIRAAGRLPLKDGSRCGSVVDGAFSR